jgi:hypothetical protein
MSVATSTSTKGLRSATSKQQISTSLQLSILREDTLMAATVRDALRSWSRCRMEVASASTRHTLPLVCTINLGRDLRLTHTDCHYRWYTVDEICMILERFDAVVFVGDASLQNIYNGFNILLRQDLATGALKAWEMDGNLLDSCHCDAQFNTPACAEHFVTSSHEVNENTPSVGSPYTCSRFPHAMLQINGSPAPGKTYEQFKKLVPRVPRSNYKPVPIIHSLTPGAFSLDQASKSLQEFLRLADASKRRTPMLWIGPTAAGHIEIKNRKGNQEIWDYDRAMAENARKNDIEVLKMWNMTVQATSFDGIGFGEKVAITQAMMVINWLSRLESS